MIQNSSQLCVETATRPFLQVCFSVFLVSIEMNYSFFLPILGAFANAGCVFISGNGLMSFDHPLHKIRPKIREDDEGKVTAILFQVDLYTRIPSIPRTGSAANWADATIVKADE